MVRLTAEQRSAFSSDQALSSIISILEICVDNEILSYTPNSEGPATTITGCIPDKDLQIVK
jgi:hypothetical protein